MAIYYARKNGNVNAADVWATTPSGTASDVFSIFTNQDVLISNSFTITLNVNTTVAEIRNDTTGGATTGGSFTLSGGITLTANIIAGSATCLSHSSGNSTIIGNIVGGTSANAIGVTSNSSGILTIIGSITGGSASNTSGLANTGGSGTVNITGNITGGSVGLGLNYAGFQSVYNIIGNILGTQSTAINGSTMTTFTITGTISNGGMNVASSSVVNIIGTAIGGVNVGVIAGAASQVTLTRAKGGPLAGSNVGLSTSSGSGFAQVEEIEFGDLGASPTSGPIRLVDKTTNVAVMYRYLSTKKTLTDVASTSLLPSTNNVRSGIVYNNGGSTGTCVIPNANSVVYGVPIDNTIGNAIISPGAFWDILTSSIGTSGSIGERLKNCSTVATVGKQLEGVL